MIKRIIVALMLVTAGLALASCSKNLFQGDTPLGVGAISPELVSEFIAPGTPGCGGAKAGRLVVSGWSQLAWRDLDSTTTTLVNLPYAAADPTYLQKGDPMMARMKDGTLLYGRGGISYQPIVPEPAWANAVNYGREVEYFWTSKCGDKWQLHSTLDASTVLRNACVWPQVTVDNPYPGGFDRDELYVDPFNGAIYWSTECKGGSKDPALGHLYRAMILFKFDPPTGSWKLVWSSSSIGSFLAMTSTSNGVLYMLRCKDYQPQLFASANGGTSWTEHDVVAPGDGADVDCRGPSSIMMGYASNTHDLSLSRSGPDSIRVAYPDTVEGGSVIRIYSVKYSPATHAFTIQPHPTLPLVTGKSGGVTGPQSSPGHFDFIEPDESGVAASQNYPAILYWTEFTFLQNAIEVHYVEFQGAGGASGVGTVSSAPFASLCSTSNGTCGWGGDYSYGGFDRGTDGVCYFDMVWPAPSSSSVNDIHFAVIKDADC